MQKQLRFKVYDGRKVVAKGGTKEISEFLGTTPGALRQAVTGRPDRIYRGYRVVLATPDADDKPMTPDLAQAIANWDALTSRLREEFGIPLYKESQNG